MKKRLFGLFSVIFALVLLVACGGKTFEVSFDLNGGTSAETIEVQKIKEGNLVTKPADPTRDGYTFAHWSLEDEEWNFATDKVTKKMTLTATWDLSEYVVSFDTLGGAPIPEEQSVVHGQKAVEPEVVPTLEGNKFLGWYLGDDLFDFDTVITEAITLKAKWSLIFTVTFDADGGIPVPADVVVEKGAKIEEPTAPTREHATFLGWFVDGEEFDFETAIEENLELQARWEFDYVAVIDALEAYYEETLGNMNWNPTEDVELIKEISGLPITWSSSDTDFFTNDGKVTIPSFSEGNKTIMLTATLTPVQSTTFFFVIESAEQTTEELLDEILRLVTIVPSSPSGYQEQNFEVTTVYDINGVEVTITWETSDETVMKANGELVPFEDAAEKAVTLTATITHDGVTREKEIHFLVKGVTSYNGFLDALTDENKGQKVRVEGVSFFSPIRTGTDTPNGYYVASADNQIAFVYGNPPANMKEDKLYDVLFEVDIYYGSYQLSSPAFINERDGDLPVITPTEMTLEEVVNLPKPLDQTFNHQYIKLVNVKVHVEDPNDNYKTFLIPQDLNPEETILTDMNSLMIYYVSNLSVIQNLNGKRIDEILLINNGYRTNNIVWYVNYIGDGSDIVMSALTDEEAVVAAKEQFEGSIPFRVINENALALANEVFGATVTWTSSDEAIIATDGTVALPEEGTNVTLTASIVSGTEELTFQREVWVVKPEDLEVDGIADLIAYDGVYSLMPFKLNGVVTGATGDRSFTLYDGTDAVAVRTLSGVKLDFGYEYTVIGTKSVFNGLIQINQITVTKGEAGELETPIALTETELKDNAYLETIQAHLVSIVGAEITNINVDNYSNTEITLKIGTAELLIRWDSRVQISQEAEDKLTEFVVGDVVNIVGAPMGWHNGPQLGYNDASQIVVSEPETNEDIVAAAIAALDIPNVTKVDLELPTVGRFEAVISWASSHPAIIAADGTLVMPEENTEVTLTATVTFGDFTDTVDFVVLVHVDEDILNVKLTRALAADSPAKFTGVISGMDPSRYVYVSDVDGSTIVLYNPDRPEGLALGDKVLVEGTLAHYNGLIQIAAGGTIEILESGLTIPDAIEVDKIPELTVDDQGKRYSIENLVVVSLSSNGRSLTVTDGIKDIIVYVDPDNEDIRNHIAGAVGKKVNLVEVHVGWFNNGQFLIGNEEEVVIVELTDNEKALADLNEIDLPTTIATDDKLTLPTLGGLHESVITWTSSDDTIIATDGTVVLPTEETTITLTATANLNDAEEVLNFVIVVKPEGSAVEQTVTLKYPGGGTSINMTGANDAELLGLDPLIFDVRSDKQTGNNHIGLNQNARLQIYQTGGGAILIVEIASGNIITGIEIKFLKHKDDGADAKILLDNVEAQNTTAADITNKTVTFNDLEITKFSIQNVHAENVQLWIDSIVITYLGEGSETPVDPDPDPEPVEVTTIADFLALEDAETATIKGIITNVGPHNSFSMEDETGAVAFRIGGKNSTNIDFVVGDEIEAEVKKADFNGLIQAELTGEYEVVSSNNTLPALVDLNEASLDAADLLQYQSRIVKLDNMEVTVANVDGYGTVDLTLKRADGATIALRWDNRVVFEGNTTMKDFKVGDIVNIAGATLGWYNNPQLAVDNINQIQLVD